MADRAIVTDTPGTTRDSLSEFLNLQGIPILITDTAGMRVSNDPIEHLGMGRTRRAIADADLVIVVIDGTQPLSLDVKTLFTELVEVAYIIALNKNDLDSFLEARPDGFIDCERCISVSARTGSGFDKLQRAILDSFNFRSLESEGLLITNSRHFDLLRRAIDALHSSQEALRQRLSEDLVLVGLYDALRFLGELTGEITPETILSQIFASFCIGK
jgi:tRNA modification GTPase